MIPGLGRFPWRRTWQPTAVFLPGEIPWTEDPGGGVGGAATVHRSAKSSTNLRRLSMHTHTVLSVEKDNLVLLVIFRDTFILSL